MSLYGVFDGHGGVKASRFASENLHKNLRDKILKGNNSMYSFQVSLQGFFKVFSGAKIRPHSQWNLGAFSPNFSEKKSQSSKKNFFLKIGISIQSAHTQATW